MTFIIQNDLTVLNQHEFIKGKSTRSVLFDFIEKIMQAFEHKRQSLSVYFDLSKKFEHVNHALLLNKLYYNGIIHQIIIIIFTYHKDHTHYENTIPED